LSVCLVTWSAWRPTCGTGWTPESARSTVCAGVLEPMQIISATPYCRVLDVTDALFITVGGTRKLVDKIEANGCRQDRSQRMVQAATESHRRPLESNRIDGEWPGSSPRSQRHFHRSPCGLHRRGRTRKRPQPAVEHSASVTPTSDDHCVSGAPGGAAAGVDQVNI
jgi:hypothetical protein